MTSPDGLDLDALRGITGEDLDGWAGELMGVADEHPHPVRRDVLVRVADQLRWGPYRRWETVTDEAKEA